LRILAEYSQEKVFLEAFKNNWDVHSVGAEIVFGEEWKNAAAPDCEYYKTKQKCACPEHKKLRDFAKTINFGIAYGMEAAKLADGVGCTVEVAEKILKKYRASFPTFIKYLESSAAAAVSKMESRTLSQRRRLFHKPTWNDAVVKAKHRLAEKAGAKKAHYDRFVPKTSEVNSAFKAMYSAIQREGKNTPIQGSNADIAKIAMGCGFDSYTNLAFMWHDLETKYNAKLVNFVHDEFVVEAPKEVAEECKKFIEDCMYRSGKELVRSVEMTAEGVIADKWKK